MSQDKSLAPLRQILADTYVLYLSTQKCHWNVESSAFYGLHLLFEKQYQSLADMVDSLAERIRARGEFSPGSFQEFQALSSLPHLEEMTGAPLKLLRFLKASYEPLISKLEHSITLLQDEDAATANLLTDQLEAHQKSLWMIKSCLK